MNNFWEDPLISFEGFRKYLITYYPEILFRSEKYKIHLEILKMKFHALELGSRIIMTKKEAKEMIIAWEEFYDIANRYLAFIRNFITLHPELPDEFLFECEQVVTRIQLEIDTQTKVVESVKKYYC